MAGLDKDYFHRACSWADDRFGLMEASRSRYQLAFLISMSAVIFLSIVLVMMLPLKSVQTVAVHHYDNGVTTVEAQSQKVQASSRAQIESDLVRYVINRESYDVSSYRTQFELVTLLSANDVAREFESQQASRNLMAPINQLGTKVTRSVHVYSINFIDDTELNARERKTKQQHHHLAEVVFSVKDHDKSSLRDTEQQFSALVSWQYVKPSNSIEERWQNFNGFEVTRYTVAQRNL